MKKLLLVLCLGFGGVAVVNAQNQDSTQAQPAQSPAPADQDRQPIQASELPDAIKTSLQSQDYTGWTVAQAFTSKQTDAADATKTTEVYIVELRNGAEMKTVTFDKAGNKLDKDK
jgi:hypothetical protein